MQKHIDKIDFIIRRLYEKGKLTKEQVDAYNKVRRAMVDEYNKEMFLLDKLIQEVNSDSKKFGRLKNIEKYVSDLEYDNMEIVSKLHIANAQIDFLNKNIGKLKKHPHHDRPTIGSLLKAMD